MSDSLLSTVRNHFTPDLLSLISDLFDEPTTQMRSSIFSAIPTVIAGLIGKSATPAGSEDIVTIIETEGYICGMPEPDAVASHAATRGQALVNRIFGNRASTVVENFAKGTGLSRGLALKVLGLVASIVMSALGLKVREEGYNAAAVAHYLSTQKTAMHGVGSTEPEKEVQTPDFISPIGAIPKALLTKRVMKYLAISLAFLAFALIFYGRSRAPDRLNWGRSQVSNQIRSDPEILASFAETLSQDSKVELPKRFSFPSLTFASGSAELSPASQRILTELAKTIRANPASKIRIEGNADTLGSPTRSRQLAEARATAVREALFRNGVSRAQIETLGSGETVPLDSNGTAQGRRNNRRIDVVIIAR